MLTPISEDKITEIFVAINDFNQLFGKEIKQLRLESSSKKRNRKSKFSDSEMMTQQVYNQ